jgi:glutamyl-tRNA synthetase
MILGPDGTKLSKRHGAVSVLEYREAGYLPEALLNYLGRLGWSHGDQEIFSLEEMVALFDLKDVNKSASALNPEKMAWTNQQHLMRAPVARLASELAIQLRARGLDPAGRDLGAIVTAQRERAKTLAEMAENSAFFFVAPERYDAKAAAKNLTTDTAAVLARARERLADGSEWTAPAIHGVLQQLADELGLALGKVAQPLRVAVAGTGVSPPIDQTLAILGRDDTIRRILAAEQYIATTRA